MIFNRMDLKKLHASSISLEDNGVLIIGPSGSGKSDLALRMIDSGATLISDDITTCRKINGSISLFSSEKIFGLIEVRGIGIIKVPYVENIKLKMIVKLTNQMIDRMPQEKKKKVMGISFPIIEIQPKEVSATAKIKLKLFEKNESK
ncbi:MAG: aldolase [Rickettsiales bacterium]|nr:aldolase [Rickettsiales bacterium]